MDVSLRSDSYQCLAGFGIGPLEEMQTTNTSFTKENASTTPLDRDLTES